MEALLKKITDFYSESRDFNGIPVGILLRELKMPWPDLRDSLTQLVKGGKSTLAFSSVSENPHIKRFPDIPAAEQIGKLESESTDGICVYPTTAVLEAMLDTTDYVDRPFTKRLALGEPQLLPVYFDLPVLERYYADPRYNFDFYDYGGSIGISSSHYESRDTAERDKVFLQTFGLGYDPQGNRVVVVFLRYLAGLSPEHQQFWNTYVLSGEYRMVEAYFRNSILGEWTEDASIYDALLEEQVVINEMTKLMGRPTLFRRTFKDDRPREFGTFLRPTRKSFFGFVLLVDKMLSQNINKEFFRNEFATEVPPRATLNLLDEWLRKTIRVEDPRVIDEIIEPLKEVRKLRQKPAHKIEADEYDREYHRKQNHLMRRAYEAVRTIRLLFANHPSVRGYEVPDWLYQGRIRVY